MTAAQALRMARALLKLEAQLAASRRTAATEKVA